MNTPEEIKYILKREVQSNLIHKPIYPECLAAAKKELADFNSNPNLYTILWNLHTRNICIDCGGLDITELLHQINEECPIEQRIAIRDYLIANIKCV